MLGDNSLCVINSCAETLPFGTPCGGSVRSLLLLYPSWKGGSGGNNNEAGFSFCPFGELRTTHIQNAPCAPLLTGVGEGQCGWEEEEEGTGAQFQEEATDGRRTRRRGWRGILLRTRQTRGSFERSSVYNPAFPGPLYLRPPVAETHRPQGSIGRTFRHTEEAIGARGGEGEYLFE